MSDPTASHPHLVIVADDLTGSLDTGVAFATRGWRTILRLADSSPEAPGADKDRTEEAPTGASVSDVIVYDTETREAEEETARRVVRNVCALPAVRSAPRLYKKIDSTLRGPWLAELREVWKARASLTTVLCPAFPAVGRTVVDGEVRVHGRPLEEAGFAGTGRLRELLLQRWCGRVVSLSVAQLGDAPLADPNREPWLLLPDAAADADLDLLAARLHQLELDQLFCGAGGLAAAWARVLIPEPRPLPPLDPVSGPVWVIAGSQHPATRAQMETLAGTPGAHVEWVEAHAADASSHLRRLPKAAIQGIALRLTSSPRHPITPSAAAWAVDFIAAVAAEARERGIAAFVATGGETAALLLRALSAATLEVDRELLSGIPLCRLADGPRSGTPLVTKAGGFGEADALVWTVAALRAGSTGDSQV